MVSACPEVLNAKPGVHFFFAKHLVVKLLNEHPVFFRRIHPILNPHNSRILWTMFAKLFSDKTWECLTTMYLVSFAYHVGDMRRYLNLSYKPEDSLILPCSLGGTSNVHRDSYGIALLTLYGGYMREINLDYGISFLFEERVCWDYGIDKGTRVCFLEAQYATLYFDTYPYWQNRTSVSRIRW